MKLFLNVAKARATHTYRAESASLRFTENLLAQMRARGVTRSALAGMIGTSPAYITKIFRGETNFTLDTMVKIAHVLELQGFHPALLKGIKGFLRQGRMLKCAA